MKANSRHSSSRQTGFSLAEIMVGLAIGMLATMVILQVLSVFETQKRTTTGAGDAQTNGSIALYTIGRDLQMAGYPLLPSGTSDDPADSPIECTALTINGVADTTAPNRLSPVAITNATSDSIVIRYGDSPTGGIPVDITAAPVASTTLPSPAMDVPVSSNVGCRDRDRVLMFNGANCALSSVPVSGVLPTAPLTVIIENNTAITAGAAVANAKLACLGSWNEITYAVNNGNLERSGQPSVVGIVNLQAQYGISASTSSNQVTQWVDATGTWGAPATGDRNRIKAIRIAVVARDAKREPNEVTNAVTAWTDTKNGSTAPTIDLSADSDWKKYRYRVFETIIPLRNVIWAKNTL
jgi:type IV pilus assembly protein PilW